MQKFWELFSLNFVPFTEELEELGFPKKLLHRDTKYLGVSVRRKPRFWRFPLILQ